MNTNKRNYQKELEKLMEQNASEGKRPSLLLHVCCAVCASYVLEYLHKDFDITVVYYNPNITEESEYQYRLSELRRYVKEAGLSYHISFVDAEYDPQSFFDLVRGHEDDREGGARCSLCFAQRLGYTARLCAEGGYDYFATTLTISPLKNAEVLNSIGEKLGEKHGVKYLCTDFKKREGYKRSIELSKQYDLYRQDYCGCVFSKRDSIPEEEIMKLYNNIE